MGGQGSLMNCASFFLTTMTYVHKYLSSQIQNLATEVQKVFKTNQKLISVGTFDHFTFEMNE